MKDTCKVIKKNARCLAQDAAYVLMDILTIIAAIILLVLQAIAVPFKKIAFFCEGKLQHDADPIHSSLTVEDVLI
jgi:hypothetical protein